jgi:hypothetical protein
MRVTDFLKAVSKEAPMHAERAVCDKGWIRTIDIAPLLGMKTLAGVRGPVARIVKAGFAEERRIKHQRLIYRLSPRFKTWAKALEAALALEAFKTPEGWVTLTQYARKSRRTVRGIQYRIDGADIARKVFRTPRPVPHYRKADLDRILSKAS